MRVGRHEWGDTVWLEVSLEGGAATRGGESVQGGDTDSGGAMRVDVDGLCAQRPRVVRPSESHAPELSVLLAKEGGAMLGAPSRAQPAPLPPAPPRSSTRSFLRRSLLGRRTHCLWRLPCRAAAL